MRDEYIYAVGYRKVKNEDESLVLGNAGTFKVLKPTWRYWWADPLFCKEKDGKVCLYVEVYDLIKRKAFIGKSVFINDILTMPQKVIEEPFHMSFPMVFFYNGFYYMVPETNKSGHVNIYRNVNGIWNKYYSFPVVGVVDICVTIKDDEIFFFVGRKKPDNGKYVKTEIWKISNIEDKEKISATIVNDTCSDYNLEERNGGRIIRLHNSDYRLKQVSTEEDYGIGINVCRINKFKGGTYEEEMIKRIKLKDISLEKNIHPKRWIGIHTYDYCDGYEVIDIAWKKKSIIGCYGRLVSRIESTIKKYIKVKKRIVH